MSTLENKGGSKGGAAPLLATDALGVVFSFVPLADMPTMMRVCRHWRHTAGKGKTRHMEIRMHYARLERLCDSLASPLRRHIATLDVDAYFQFEDGIMHKMRALPNLTAVTLRVHDIDAWILNVPYVTSLVLPSVILTDHHLELFRQMPALIHLRTKSKYHWPASQLHALCRTPCTLQLQEIHLDNTILDRKKMEILTQMPSLTALEPNEIHRDALPLLSHFPQLQRLRLGLYRSTCEPLIHDNFESYFATCASLTHLALVVASFNTLQFLRLQPTLIPRIIHAVPQLRSLCLESCEIMSLQFLQHAAPKLESLVLRHCTSLRAIDVMHLEQIVPCLTSLHVDRCKSVYFDAQCLLALQTPSLFMPKLKKIYYATYTPQYYVVEKWLRR